MNFINIKKAKQNLHKLVENVNNGFNPITIINNKGKNAILILQKEWKNIEETLYLLSIPNLVNNINEIRENENWKNTTKYNENEEW